jgi:diguanylate cyclase (GGDEF)-like protein
MSKSYPLDTEEVTVVDNKDQTQHFLERDVKLSVILTIIQGSDIDFGKSYTFPSGPIRIGREKDNSVPIDDPKVSKEHCEIFFETSSDHHYIVVRDIGSTNGCYVNGDLTQRQVLKSGDKVTIGDTVIRIDCNDDVEEGYRSKLFNIASTDALTGLYSRRYILNELEKQYKIAKRNNRLFSILVLDIDDFKYINDTHGHSAGDEFLKKIAFTINDSLREQDICGRIGGEEFLIVLPETDIEGGFILADRIRSRIEASEIEFQSFIIKATVSTGVCQFSPDEPPPTSETLFQWADHALYIAKNSGKNKVIKHQTGISKINQD